MRLALIAAALVMGTGAAALSLSPHGSGLSVGSRSDLKPAATFTGHSEGIGGCHEIRFNAKLDHGHDVDGFTDQENDECIPAVYLEPR